MSSREQEAGIALLITIIFLLLLSAIGINALQRVQDENIAGASSRRQVRNLSVADAGIQLALRQLQAGVGSAAIDTAPINLPALVDANLQGTNLFATGVRSGVIGNPVPQPILFLGYVGSAGNGSQLNLGSGNGGGGQLAIYRVTMVAQDSTGGAVQVQAQLAVDAPAVGY